MNVLRHHARSIAVLATPLLVNNLGVGGMLSADTIMAGRLGPDALAAVAVGANYIGIFHFAAIGTLMALSPLVAHAFGAQRHHEIGGYMRQGLWLAALLSVVLVLGLLAARPVLLFIQVPPATADLASRYVAAFALGVPALCGFYALRFGSEGIGWTRPVMYTAVVGLVTNVALNWVLMYGHFGMPALGAVGTGYATAITWWVLFAILWVYVKRHRVYAPFAPLQQREALHPTRFREIAKLGAPIAGSLVLEGGMFNAAALLLASLGAAVIAAHAIAINYAALMFMIPLSLNSATTIHVGHCLGAGDARGARRAAFTGIGMGVCVMAISALVMVVAREQIAALYTGDQAVIELAAMLLLYAAVFQIADGVQVCTAGALRGYKDTRIPMIVNLLAYWGIGFPLAWWFGVHLARGAPGVWIGLIAGLFVASVLLVWRLVAVTRSSRGSASRFP
ncbi:MAG: MATE family efflux transporter [Steroidobacteraceae bacterium]